MRSLMTSAELPESDLMLSNSEAITGSRSRGGRPKPLTWPDGPDVGQGPLDRLTLAAVGVVEGDGQLIHQVGRRIRERPALAPDLRVVAVLGPGIGGGAPRAPRGGDLRGGGGGAPGFSFKKPSGGGLPPPPGGGPPPRATATPA